MSDDFKNKFKAKAEADKARAEQRAETDKKYPETVLREYPRLLRELHERIAKIFDGVPEVTVTTQERSEMLILSNMSSGGGVQEKRIGPVKIPDIEVIFSGRRLSFRGAGTNHMWIHGKIEVAHSGAGHNPFGDGIAMVVYRGEPNDKWKTAMAGERGPKGWVELTDELLKQKLESFFLS